MTETTTIVPTTETIPEKSALPAVRPQIAAGATPRGIVPTSLEEVQRIATMAVGAGLMGKAEVETKVAVAQAALIIMKGLELGLTPTMALDGIAVINGRTCVWGKMVPALIRRAGHKIEEWEEGERMTDAWTFHCRITRGDTAEVIHRKFSVLDAKQAGLWSQQAKVVRRKRDGSTWEATNDSPWYKYPQRMLPARAKGYAAADGAPEALLGMYTAEEMQDVAREEELAAEERGHLVVTAPPPVLADETEDALGTGAEALGTPPSAPADSEGEAAPDMEAAVAGFIAAAEKAQSMERLDKLTEVFHEKFDGYITLEIGDRCGQAYEAAERRIGGSAE